MVRATFSYTLSYSHIYIYVRVCVWFPWIADSSLAFIQYCENSEHIQYYKTHHEQKTCTYLRAFRCLDDISPQTEHHKGTYIIGDSGRSDSAWRRQRSANLIVEENCIHAGYNPYVIIESIVYHCRNGYSCSLELMD